MKKRLKKVQKLWLEALRSGKYKQAVGQLREGNHFCCLGVLCDLYGKEKGKKWKNVATHPSFLNDLHLLPFQVIKWCGLKDYDPIGVGGKSLSTMNDRGKSFKEIADFIDKSRGDLFL